MRAIPHRRKLPRTIFGEICQQCVLWRPVKSTKALYGRWLSGCRRCWACRTVRLKWRVYGHCAKSCRGPSQPDRRLGQSNAEKHLFVMPGLSKFWHNDNSTRGAATANASIGSRGGYVGVWPLLDCEIELDTAVEPYSKLRCLGDDRVFGLGATCAVARHRGGPLVRMTPLRFGTGRTPDAPVIDRTLKKQTPPSEYPKQRFEPTMSPSSSPSACDCNYLSQGGEI